MAETGLQPGDQKIMFRGKERENGQYLELCGVKDKSKVLLIEDPASIERRYIQMRKNSRIQSAHRAISSVSMEVDKLAEQVIITLFNFLQLFLLKIITGQNSEWVTVMIKTAWLMSFSKCIILTI